MVKPYALPLRNNKLSAKNLYIIDNAEYLTILVNRQVSEEHMIDLFGYSTLQELSEDENYPAYVAPETERAGLLQQLLE